MLSAESFYSNMQYLYAIFKRTMEKNKDRDTERTTGMHSEGNGLANRWRATASDVVGIQSEPVGERQARH